MRSLRLLALLAILPLAGCNQTAAEPSLIAQTEKKMAEDAAKVKKDFEDFRAELRRKTQAWIKECKEKGEPAIGMTKSQLFATCWERHRRPHINTTVTANGTIEQVIYHTGDYVYLRNGVVETIQK